MRKFRFIAVGLLLVLTPPIGGQTQSPDLATHALAPKQEPITVSGFVSKLVSIERRPPKPGSRARFLGQLIQNGGDGWYLLFAKDVEKVNLPEGRAPFSDITEIFRVSGHSNWLPEDLIDEDGKPTIVFPRMVKNGKTFHFGSSTVGSLKDMALRLGGEGAGKDSTDVLEKVAPLTAMKGWIWVTRIERLDPSLQKLFAAQRDAHDGRALQRRTEIEAQLKEERVRIENLSAKVNGLLAMTAKLRAEWTQAEARREALEKLLAVQIERSRTLVNLLASATDFNAPAIVIAVQEKLNEKGFKTGKPDGQIGPATRAAIQAYEASQGLVETGQLSDALLLKLYDLE